MKQLFLQDHPIHSDDNVIFAQYADTWHAREETSIYIYNTPIVNFFMYKCFGRVNDPIGADNGLSVPSH